MGFSSALQGQASHEALLSRQDAEIRLLENMRRCLALRVKADRDYAMALNSFVMQAGGSATNAAEAMIGSGVAKAWASFIEESEKMSKYVKEGADFLAGTVLEKISELYAEKKANRKQYQEESLKIASELRSLQEAVQKTKSEYERCLENYASSKAKYEEQSSKGRLGNKRFEDAKERYQKACKKLHQTHNDYVLLLCEASEFERDTRTLLLPCLLEHQQAIQEDMIDKWKIILQEVQRSCNLSDKRYQDLHERIASNVDAVKSSEEYLRFIEVNKTTPSPAIQFKFDEAIVATQESMKLGMKLNPNCVVLDDLTIDSLKMKLADNEAKLADCRSQIQDKQTLIIQYETELSTVQFKSDPASVSRMFFAKKMADISKKEINQLRCKEQKLSRQNELIQVPLQELGCEQAPVGCELITNNENDPGNGSTEALGSKGKKSGQQVISMFKKPFSTIGTRKLAGSQSWTGSRQDFDPSSTEDGSDLKETNNSEDVIDSRNNTPDPGLEQDNANSALPNFDPRRPLEEELWFHGVLPRGEVVRLLASDGDFLVRESTRNDEKQIVLSVMWTNPKHFIVQTGNDGKFRFEGPSFNTVQELIEYQFSSQSAVTSRSGAILGKPILREKWELNNDDVELIDKIGRGNFGDVYRAKLKPESVPVAVKTCKTTLPDEQKKKFLQEGRILKQYDHPNIVKFIGICVQKQPIMIVMELVSGGSLLNYLRNNGNHLNQKGLLGMCLDAAAGMQYLESKNCIHRDLAARNCLVGEGNTVKISDFGMSREEEEYTVSDGLKQIPIKWTAPEALNYGKYTSLCDVWSYGVLCWEIFSKGGTPYQGMTNTRAREMIESGYRMPAPEGAPTEIYQLMLRCWQEIPEDRPHFPEIRAQVDLMYSRASVGPETRV